MIRCVQLKMHALSQMANTQDIGVLDQFIMRTASVFRVQFINVPFTTGMEVFNLIHTNNFTLVQKGNAVAVLGLIHIRGAHDHCHTVIAEGFEHGPQLMP